MLFPSKIDRWLAGVLAASLGAGAVSAGASGILAVWIPVALSAALVLWLVLQTTYRISETALEIRCACFRTRVPLDAILSLRASRNPISAPALSLDRIDVRHRSGHVLISPRDRAGFVAAVLRRVPHVEVLGLPGATAAGGATASGTLVPIAVAAVGAAATLVIAAAVIVGGSRPPTVAIDSGLVRVRSPLASTSFSREDVMSVSFGERLPAVGKKLMGFAALGSMRGRFRVDGLGDGHVFAEDGRPYVLIRTADSFVLVGFADDVRTREVYDELQPLAPR